MANNFLDSEWVSMKVLRLLLNKLVVAEYFNRSWDKDFDKEFAVGSQITVKFPQRFRVNDGMGYQPQGINRLQTPINLDQWMQVAFEWDDYEQAVKVERSEKELTEQYFDPAAAALAQECDSRCANWARQNLSMTVGALGTDPTSVQTYYQARQRLEENAAGVLGKRGMLISSSMMTTLGTNITTIFHPADEITKAWKEGVIGELGASMFYESQSLYSHTAGTWAGTNGYPIVAGAGQSGTSLVITANAGDTFNAGDKFSIAAVNLVNPMTYRIPGKAYNKVFTITQAYTAVGGAGADTINFLPPIYGPASQYQNVDNLAANGAALTLFPGTASPNGKVGTMGLNLTRQAFAIVGAKLYQPKSVESSGAAQDSDTGLSVRKVKAWDPVRSVGINRMDSLFGLGNLYQDNGGVAVLGA
jgi:hypothetical protein